MRFVRLSVILISISQKLHVVSSYMSYKTSYIIFFLISKVQIFFLIFEGISGNTTSHIQDCKRVTAIGMFTKHNMTMSNVIIFV